MLPRLPHDRGVAWHAELFLGRDCFAEERMADEIAVLLSAPPGAIRPPDAAQ